jgi:hypothetical protein
MWKCARRKQAVTFPIAMGAQGDFESGDTIACNIRIGFEWYSGDVEMNFECCCFAGCDDDRYRPNTKRGRSRAQGRVGA